MNNLLKFYEAMGDDGVEILYVADRRAMVLIVLRRKFKLRVNCLVKFGSQRVLQFLFYGFCPL